MEKKSSVKEVHKLVQQDYPNLYKKLCIILGDENPFAQFNIGAGIYIWSDTRCDWKQMVMASQVIQENVRTALVKVRQRMSAKLGDKQTELLLTVPDDSYIYYNNDGGDMKVLLTGWGFKKPVIVSTKHQIVNVNTKPTTIAFVFDGEKIPNYQFGLRLANQKRILQTDDNGECNINILCDGKQYSIYDIQNDNKEYILSIIPDQAYYEIDLTKHTTLHLEAMLDGQPMGNENICIQYHGITYNTLTGGDGKASIKIPLYVGEELTANLRDKTESISVKEDDNNIHFVFVSPTPVVETDVVVYVMLDSVVCPNKEVSIDYCSKSYSGITDEKGQFIQHLNVRGGECCVVSVDGYTAQQRELTENATNEFLFEKTTPQPEPPVTIAPKLIVKRVNGDVVMEYPVKVEASDGINNYVTDSKGEVILPEMTENDVMSVIDGKDETHKEMFKISSSQEYYIFTIPDEEPVPEQQLKIMFRDKDVKAIQCENVIFKQEGIRDVIVSLDDNGDVYLPADTFVTGKEISATINGWKEKYSPITFMTEENEYEYLLQEKETKKLWQMIILQILSVLVAIIAAIILWPFMEAVFAGLYEGIYNAPSPGFYR